MKQLCTLRFDFAVVGGGPAGALAALRLAQQGHSVCILEKAGPLQEENDYYELMTSEAQASLVECTGTGYPILEEWLPVRRSVIKWNSPQVGVTHHMPGEAPLAIGRSSFAARLRSIAGQQGVSLFQGVMVRKMTREGNCSILHCTDHGAGLTVQAGLVIIASGRQGRRLTDTMMPEEKAALAQGLLLRQTGADYLEDFLVESNARSGHWWYAIPAGYRQVFLCCCAKANGPQELFRDGAALLKAAKQMELTGSLLGDCLPAGKILHRWAVSGSRPCVAGDGWVAVGDAAFAQDPLSGRGLDFSIYSATLLTSVLQEAGLTAGARIYTEHINHHARLQEAQGAWWRTKDTMQAMLSPGIPAGIW